MGITEDKAHTSPHGCSQSAIGSTTRLFETGLMGPLSTEGDASASDTVYWPERERERGREEERGRERERKREREEEREREGGRERERERVGLLTITILCNLGGLPLSRSRPF
jgi:hypothetical protein